MAGMACMNVARAYIHRQSTGRTARISVTCQGRHPVPSTAVRQIWGWSGGFNSKPFDIADGSPFDIADGSRTDPDRHGQTRTDADGRGRKDRGMDRGTRTPCTSSVHFRPWFQRRAAYARPARSGPATALASRLPSACAATKRKPRTAAQINAKKRLRAAQGSRIISYSRHTTRHNRGQSRCRALEPRAERRIAPLGSAVAPRENAKSKIINRHISARDCVWDTRAAHTKYHGMMTDVDVV